MKNLLESKERTTRCQPVNICFAGTVLPKTSQTKSPDATPGKSHKFRNMSCSPPGELLTVLYRQKTHRCRRTEQLAIPAFGCEGHSYHRQQLTPGTLQFCVREDAHLQICSREGNTIVPRWVSRSSTCVEEYVRRWGNQQVTRLRHLIHLLFMEQLVKTVCITFFNRASRNVLAIHANFRQQGPPHQTNRDRGDAYPSQPSQSSPTATTTPVTLRNTRSLRKWVSPSQRSRD